MRPIGWSISTLTALGLGLALSACGKANPYVGGGDGGGGGSLCATCHGTAGRTGTLAGTDANLEASPPAAPAGEPAQVVGAHQAHLNPAATGSLSGPLACSECHVVPTDASHASNPPAQIVQFGTLAKTGGAAPTWNSTDKISNTTCSNVYCHGNFNWNGVTGTVANAPDWTGNPAACGSCHGLPPTGHIALPGTPTAATCNGCHPGTVDAAGKIIVDVATGTSLHVNGQIDVSGTGSCTACHGDPARPATALNPRLPAAPPVGTNGETLVTTRAVGAHQLHLNDNAIRGAVACSECHVVPTDPGHANGTVDIAFGTLATTTANGTITPPPPVWNGNSCSASYCHGNFEFGLVNQPVWTAARADACGTCHALPPSPATTTHPALAATATRATCNVCHPTTVKTDGTIDVPGGKHIDGVEQVLADAQHPAGWLTQTSTDFHAYKAEQNINACLQCHVASGTATVTTVRCSDCHGANWTTNCTMCHGGTDNTTGAPPKAIWAWDNRAGNPTYNPAEYAIRTGAHTSHVEATLSSPIACSECHVVPADAFSTGHIDAPTATLTFGTLATHGGVNPVWNRAGPSCSASYCHGNFTNGKTANAPVWTGTNQAACGTCHNVPPTSGPNISNVPAHTWHVVATAGPQLACSACHAGYTSTTVNAAVHVNGTVDVQAVHAGQDAHGWNCGACH
jgi:predicted CxxxxCH...CXXCH cytochrome family protein